METYDNYLINLITKLRDIQCSERKNLINAKIKSKNYYDQKINPQDFKIGDNVYLLNGPKSKKFGDQYSGQYEVLKILGKGSIKILIQNKPKIIHINRFRLSYISPKKCTKRRKQ